MVVCRDHCAWWVLGRAGPLFDLRGKFNTSLTGSVKNLLQYGACSVCICSMKCFKTRLPILLITSIAKVSPSFLSNVLLRQFLSLLYGPSCPISFLRQCKGSLASQGRKPTGWQWYSVFPRQKIFLTLVARRVPESRSIYNMITLSLSNVAADGLIV